MADERLLRQILTERYGIRTDSELLDAIKKMERLDIGWATRCCNDEYRGKTNRRKESRKKT